MIKNQLLKIAKNPLFLLILILLAFLLKGIFLSVLFPIFSGQDETRHYNTVQYLAEPKEKNWDIIDDPEKLLQDDNKLETFHVSEEIKKTAVITDTEVLRTEMFNTIDFSSGFDGKNEANINPNNQEAINKIYPPDKTGSSGQNLLHLMGSYVEKIFANQSILVRFYLVRILSVLFGMLTVLLCYFIAKNIGFTEKQSLLITAIVSFQPKFSMYTTNVGYAPLLFFAFALFIFGGILALKKGPNWKNVSLMIVSIYLAVRAKATGYVLLVPMVFLFAYVFYKKIKDKSKNIKYLFYSALAIVFVLLFLFSQKYMPSGDAGFTGLFASLGKYLEKSLTWGTIGLTSRTYWGTLGWVSNWFLENTVNIIRIIELFALVGLGFFFFSKKKFDFLPEKKYIIFLLGIIVALQLGIRLYDWRIFDRHDALDIGTPGRYFLPYLGAHIIVIFTGLGALLGKKEYLEKSLIVGLILMMLLMMYLIFDVIILRYYL